MEAQVFKNREGTVVAFVDPKGLMFVRLDPKKVEIKQDGKFYVAISKSFSEAAQALNAADAVYTLALTIELRLLEYVALGWSELEKFMKKSGWKKVASKKSR